MGMAPKDAGRPASPATTSALATRFAEVRAVTESLARPLSPEDCALQSMPDASPVKWHLAHTSWFFETFLLASHRAGYREFHPRFRVLFNSYYNGVGDKHPRPERGLISRPALGEVLAYRAHVDREMTDWLAGGALPADLAALIELGLHHEQQHQELILTDLKHLLSCNPLRPAYQKQWPLTPVANRQARWIAIAGGVHEIGHAGAEFAFDNEMPRHRVHVEPFQLASHLVTHGEYLAFIEDGGYTRPDLWLSLGWDTVQAQGWRAPLYWEKRDADWWTFTLRGMVPIDPHSPICHLSFFEAEAYARWAGARLPTEAEWEIAAAAAPIEGNFLESGALHPLALRDAYAAGVASQMFGDVWEWTRSDYSPYPGFRTTPGAVGEYNGKFMSSQYVLRGGSCATPRSHIRATYRNFFPPAARWQFSGVRLARDA